MNIVLRELRANRKSLLIWCVISFLFVVVGFSKFSAYYGNPELLAILNDIPAPVLEAFSFNAFNLTTLTGFFGVMFIYFALILSIAAAMWGSDVITKEERDKTVEFALTLPVTRGRLIAGKTVAVVIDCIILLIVTMIATLLSSTSLGSVVPYTDNYFATLNLALFSDIVFLAIGVLLGCALTNYKRASALAVAILLGTYFLSVLAGLNKSLNFLKFFTPFKYFDAANILHNSQLDWPFVALSVGIIALCLIAAHVTYSKRDLYI